MGFFSWFAQDTGRSISNQFSPIRPVTVYMFDNKGNKWREDNYEGYGEFGGKDYYELMAEMNGLTTRDEAIDLEFKSGKSFITPNLAEDENWEWRDEKPEDCPYQGFFYGDDEEEDEEDN